MSQGGFRRLTTIKECYKLNYSRISNAVAECDYSFEELKANGVLKSWVKETERGARKKILDVCYTVRASDEFCKEAKASNKRKGLARAKLSTS